MTTGGRGIPRLQELTYLEVVVTAVHDKQTFEEIRRQLVSHMATLRSDLPSPGNTAAYRLAIADPRRYVKNVAETLKELMRLGLAHPAVLPSTKHSAYAHQNSRYALTDMGEQWVEQLASEKRAAYDRLLGWLWHHHPQLRGYLGLAQGEGFVVPTAQWGELPEPRTREAYITLLAGRAATGAVGWATTAAQAEAAVAVYVKGLEDRAEGRGKTNPHSLNQPFVQACEEALVKYAFGRTGLALDYISHEIIRRWCRFLAISGFSYHVPGPPALRIWTSADLAETDNGLEVSRHSGLSWREQAARAIRPVYDLAGRLDRTGSLWVPIYKVRAGVCWNVRISEQEFDQALIDMMRGEIGADLDRVNPDQSLFGSLPPSERPLIVQTAAGPRTYHSMSLVPRRDEPSTPQTKEIR